MTSKASASRGSALAINGIIATTNKQNTIIGLILSTVGVYFIENTYDLYTDLW